jgi:predicted DsbA family dithiol-disulfide isomerase
MTRPGSLVIGFCLFAAAPHAYESGKHADAIRKDLAEAQQLQVTGTPTFFIGVTGPGDSEMKATRLVGAQPYSAFKAAIDRLLAAPK